MAPSFARESLLPVSVEDALAWHARPGAFARLAPPWQPIELVKPNDGIEAGATLTMRLPILGRIGITWHALHEAPHGYRGFRDIQARGPFHRWEHDHVFEAAEDGRAKLIDRVAYELPLSPVSQPFAGWAVRAMLGRMFSYRHEVTRADLARHAAFADATPRRIAVTGASGLVGSALVGFLTTGGHHVVKLVRGEPRAEDEVRWDPQGGAWDASALDGFDAVIHLAGENIADRRWSEAHKARVRRSRTDGTKGLVAALGRLAHPPKALLCASAVGFYGAWREGAVDESAAPGNDFMADVCVAWEDAAREAEAFGMRVTRLRIGVVLAANGGALAKMLPAFQLGVGGPIAGGAQTMSWVSLDDVLYAIHFLLMHPSAEGAFNLTAPTPATNAAFAHTLGRVLHRPSFMPLPSFAVKAAFGEMGEALLLGSIDVRPRGLEALGFRFEYPELEGALRHALGLSLGA